MKKNARSLLATLIVFAALFILSGCNRNINHTQQPDAKNQPPTNQVTPLSVLPKPPLNTPVPVTPPLPETPPTNKPSEPTAAAGTISGKVTLAQGNCMPALCNPKFGADCPSGCNIIGVSRKIYIRKTALLQNMNGVYLKKDNKPFFVKTITSEKDGTYSTALPPGEYSLFVEDNGAEYCNYFDGQGRPCVVKIAKGGKTQFNLQIDHAVW